MSPERFRDVRETGPLLARVALIMVRANYHRNVQVSIFLNQLLALTMLRARGGGGGGYSLM